MRHALCCAPTQPLRLCTREPRPFADPSSSGLCCLVFFQALCGTAIEIPTLDNRTLSVPISDIVKPGYKTVVAGEGMPIPEGGKGNMIIEVS